MRNISRKSLYLNKNVIANQEIKEEDFNLKRPGLGTSPLEISNILGKSYKREIKEGELLNLKDVN